MATSVSTTHVLVIDPLHEYYAAQLTAAFPALAVKGVRSREAVGDAAADVDIIAAMGSVLVFDEQLLQQAPRLKWIQAFTTGTDGVTRLKSLRPEVLLTSMRGIHGPQMAEMALFMMIALARDYPRMLRNQDRQVWDRRVQKRIHGKTLAILGVGIIGAELARRAKAFGMNVIGITETPRPMEGFDRMALRKQLEQVAAEADFLVVLVPYSAATANIVDARILGAMKPSAFLVNLARGGVVDEEALIDALKDKRIAGAGLDVFAKEPLAPGNALWKMENVICSPHLGGQCDVYHEQVMQVMGANMKCFLENRRDEMVNIVAH
jgi:phosphoglycerate dehydrogenase-like enzyme